MKTTFQNELAKAQKHNYAIPAFNFDNLEMLKAIIAAAELEHAPVIIMVTESAAKYMGFNYVTSIGISAAKEAKVPVLFHWDHGYDLSLVKQAIISGYDSVMLDASLQSLEVNIAQTKEVVKLALKYKVGVESEIGHVGGKEDDTNSKIIKYSSLEEAKYFAEQTNVDCLALAVGNMHGIYQGPVNLKLDLIQKAAATIKMPLVLHGASGISDKLLQEAISMGICKINIGTDLKIAYSNGLRSWFNNNPDGYDARKFGTYAIDEVVKIARHKIKVLQANDKIYY